MNMKIKSLLLGTLLGGLAAFVWSTVSWEVLGWHEKTLLGFQKDEEVAAMISSHTVQSGTYLLPYGQPTDPGLIDRMQKGPIMVAAVRRGGFGSMAQGMVFQVLILMAAAFLLTWLLLQTSGLGYARRVAFLAVVGLSASVIVDLPNWNWWGFSGAFTAVNLADNTLTWLLAGLVIARFAKGRKAAEAQG
jgi:hypothetical protein